MSKTVRVREFRTHLSELLDEVADPREHVTVTRRGRPAAVLVPVHEYEALEETAEILSDEDTLVSLRSVLEGCGRRRQAPAVSDRTRSLRVWGSPRLLEGLTKRETRPSLKLG